MPRPTSTPGATPVPAGPAVDSPVALKLWAAGPITEKDIDILSTAECRKVARNTDIVSEGELIGSVVFLTDGWAARYQLLGDGRKQVVNFLLPGDLVATPVAQARQFIGALTEATLIRVRPSGNGQTAPPSTSLWNAIDALFASEFNLLAERTVSLGRRNAKERMAHWLLELYERLDRVSLVQDHSFALPVTQEMIGDALGLSVVHVNRTLRALRTEGLATVGFGRATLRDIDGLAALADVRGGGLATFDDPSTSNQGARSH